MSTLIADNYGTSELTVPMDTITEGAVTSWVQWGMVTTSAIDDDYNFSSLTDEGTGETTLDFTSNYSNGLYASAYSNIPEGNARTMTPKSNGTAYETSTMLSSSIYLVVTHSTNSAEQDEDDVSIMVCGNLP